jgi:hypothetical protein
VQRDVVGAREQRADGLLRVAAADVGLVMTGRVCSVVDEQVIVAVQIEHLEAQHEALQDRVRLEGEDAVEVALIARHNLGAVDLPVRGEEVVLRLLTQLTDLICGWVEWVVDQLRIIGMFSKLISHVMLGSDEQNPTKLLSSSSSAGMKYEHNDARGMPRRWQLSRECTSIDARGNLLSSSTLYAAI